ncbi:MAG: DUF3078 domain-containing protein [candidate division Zixibacteria bacterium]|nr:DUF3078 domain-containing protein [candidate division Zixibacteria bacterium]
MKSYMLAAGLVLAVGTGSIAQEAPKAPIVKDSSWRITVTAGLTATQTAYSSNWAGGEAGSFSWAFTSLTQAGKQLSSKANSANVLKLAFGQTLSQQRQPDGTLHWTAPQKSTDLIDFESVFRFTLQKFVDPYLALRAESEFFDGSVPGIKRYLSPLKTTESGGILKVFRDDPKKLVFKSRLGFALRQISTKDVIDTLLNTKWNTTNDGGIESVTDLTAQLRSNLGYTTKLTLYKALFFSKSKEALTNNWKSPDMNWEHLLSASITKYLQTTLYFQMLYDKEIDADVRIKETLGLGLSWKFTH